MDLITDSIAESLGIGLAAVDATGRQTYVNPAFAELVGWPREELVGALPPFVYWPPEDQARIQQAFDRMMRGGPPTGGFELQLARRDGSRLHVLTSVMPLLRGGHQVGWVASFAEMTERSRAEVQQRFLIEAGHLLASSLEYETTLTSLARLTVPALADYCLIDLLEADGTVKRVSIAHKDPERVEQLWEIWRRWPVRMTDEMGIALVLRSGAPLFFGEIPPDLLQEYATDPEQHAALVAMSIESSMVVPVTVRGRILGAITLNSTQASRRHGPDDLHLAMWLGERAGVAIENSRLHRAEQEARRTAERLQIMTEALSEALSEEQIGAEIMRHGITPLGACGGVIALKTSSADGLAIRASIGYPQEGCMGKGHVWPLDAAIPIAEATRTGEPVFVQSPDAWAARYDAYERGASESAAWAALPLRVDGEPRGALLWTFNQPTRFTEAQRSLMLSIARQSMQAFERARLFEAERTARAEAETANRAKMEFLTTMSHELRTPLNAIAGYVDLLELGIHGPLNSAQLEALARVRRSGRHLLSLINDVLNFAKLAAGRVVFSIEEIDVDHLLCELEPLIAPQLQLKQLEFQLSLCDSAVKAYADHDKVRQILLNLLSNAIKFTPVGGSVRLAAEQLDHIVSITVTDTGSGIPNDKLTQIFDPFIQLDRGLTSTHEGTGLGLSISQDLARAIGGTLTVESQLGEGSAFTLHLPRA